MRWFAMSLKSTNYGCKIDIFVMDYLVSFLQYMACTRSSADARRGACKTASYVSFVWLALVISYRFSVDLGFEFRPVGRLSSLYAKTLKSEYTTTDKDTLSYSFVFVANDIVETKAKVAYLQKFSFFLKR